MNREAWLLELAKHITPIIENTTNIEMPKYRISVGFPSRGALSTKRRVIGQCWSGLISPSGHSELFISPMIDDRVSVAATVAHEMIHAAVGVKEGHRKPFSRAARGIGLEGKPTATYAGPKFISHVKPILKNIGSYPHTALALDTLVARQTTNMLKVQCGKCGYVLRTTSKWLTKQGAPICPCNNLPMDILKVAK
jgi:hypothetical protein